MHPFEILSFMQNLELGKLDLTRPLIETDTKFIDLAIDRSVNIKKILL